MTVMKISSRNLPALHRRSLVKGGMAGILASGLAPAFARAEPKKLVMAHLNSIPESAAIAFDWQAQEVRKRSNGELDMQFFGGTLLIKELEIMNAVKSGNIAGIMAKPDVDGALVGGASLDATEFAAIARYQSHATA